MDLPPGLHELRFSSTTDDRASDVDVMIDERSKLVRHSMEERSGSRGGMTAGGLLLGLGGSFVLTGTVLATRQGFDREQRELGTVNIVMGALSLVVGAIVVGTSRAVRRPGATVEVALPARAPATPPAETAVAGSDPVE